nr:PREDICTED: uncharacterized protein C15orf43 homolog isoform X1 [Lepisosteus oculatus]XP_015198633.1 PREDICTED: uncharacterized protein C15orf43 homolog isoform X1 [Lepisosteus oculatus]
MFKDRKAWFSQSVPRRFCDMWMSEGGIITDWTTADYIFSKDASHPDTHRLYESLDYSKNRLTVFHASYLSACEKNRNKVAVSVGHFVLPPSSVQKEVKAAVGSFIWEKEDNQSTKQLPCGRIIQMEKQKDKEYHSVGKDSLKKDSNKIRQVTCGIKNPQRDMPLCCNPQYYPINNMFTGYLFINQLKKYSGELADFLPGHAGYSVCKAHSEKFTFKSKNRNDKCINSTN